MKFSALCCTLLACATGTQACIRVHAYLSNDLVVGDRMSVKIYDGYDEICQDGARKWMASGETKWKFKCGDDDRYEVHLTADGSKGQVWNHNAGYKADLISKDHKHEVQCSYRTGLNDRCAGYTSTDETTLWDGFGDCDDRFNTKNCGSGSCNIADKDKALACAVALLGGVCVSGKQ